MSINRELVSSGINREATATSEGWVRNPDWLDMPTLTAGVDEEITALVIINNTDSNYIAFTVTGAYTVDWGDGNTENVATGVAAEHNYAYADLGADTEFTDNGQTVRQAIIRITPQGGSSLDTIDWNIRHSDLSVANTTYLLDVDICAGNLTSSKFGSTVRFARLERLIVTDIGTVTNGTNFHLNLIALRKINLWDTSSMTTATNFLSGCVALKSTDLPLFNFSSVITANNIFNGSVGLSELPAFNLSSANNVAGLTQGAETPDISALTFGAGITNISTFCDRNYAMHTIPAMDWSSVTNTSLALRDAYGIKRILATGLTVGIDLSDTQMGATELDEFFTNCGTSNGAQTITVTGTPGAATCDTSIATAKGWTVVT